MKFRTEIDLPKSPIYGISHNDHIVMLGSCFTDNIGAQLSADGFDVIHNPMGTLYNPLSIRRAMQLALGLDSPRLVLDNRENAEASWHCLDFSTRYSHNNRNILQEMLTADLQKLGRDLNNADIVIITLGTAYVYEWEGKETVGNCHKLPSSCFTRRRMPVDEVSAALRDIIDMVPKARKVIFTVSPVRHIADGLHANNLSKSTLMLGAEAVLDHNRVCMFPAYEIMCDDLRDYRFYGADLKHPSDFAINYIYDIFGRYSFDAPTLARAREERRVYQQKLHRQIRPSTDDN